MESELGDSDEDGERSSEDSRAEEFRQAEERGAAHDIAGELDYYVSSALRMSTTLTSSISPTSSSRCGRVVCWCSFSDRCGMQL